MMKYSVSGLSQMADSSHVQVPRPLNVASTTEELNFYFYLVYINIYLKLYLNTG